MSLRSNCRLLIQPLTRAGPSASISLLSSSNNIVNVSQSCNNRTLLALTRQASYSSSSTSPRLKDSEFAKYKEYYRNLKSLTINEIPEEIASKSPLLITLHSRLQLPESFKYSTLSRCLTCRSSQLPTLPSSTSPKTVTFSKDYCDNHGLNIFGKNILSYYVTKKLLEKYPRLPTVILNAAIDSYISDYVLSSIGSQWGIDIEKQTVMERYLQNEPFEITLGKLRFYNNSLNYNDGIEIVSWKKKFNQVKAMSLAVRSIIGSLWIESDQMAEQQQIKKNLAFKFIDDHIISRKLDVSKLFMFEQPTRELSKLCEREGLERPISKLLAESGRASKAPVFIVGVFSDKEKLGEGYGSSLKEAKARAATDALLKWYCYEPTNLQSPVIDPGTVIV
ncbi:mitochondrial 54S ribosomal protein mL44 NDAI_0B01480 [Naumovozyma dairenensis CBS 421]|uniref:Large ribosomal subunit protein mL44 n=1 Tax=Naumovozyma dairenensis (strain ATCC 10597 / BCRC 20456 / CBS 421 / NBRC 0211 / NRRL Y-12639) TaxID=1071378 RepID=G0W5X1_NAUDC|nr:hypothetical protein NDAI_0B01480 [Naumovozyma dairenensis CBS 421]CCD23182.1 hypothetical protein NDAI_0B01480 [Naumovozyma dairenensis CBS 421]